MKNAAPQKKAVAREVTGADFRLELLKMVYRHDKQPADIIARAAEFERWIAART